MKIPIIKTHLTYPGWSEGKLNLAFMELAKAFFVERGHQVAETFVERGYDPEEEVQKHVAADLVILQMPVNWFSAPWIYKKYVDEVFNVGLAKEVLLAGDGRTRQDPAASMARAAKCRERSS
jgi:modulator of drug activity B